LKKTNYSFGINSNTYSLGLSLVQFRIYFAMKWHDVLKESVSPDSFKDINLCALRVSSVAGGEIDFEALKL